MQHHRLLAQQGIKLPRGLHRRFAACGTDQFHQGDQMGRVVGMGADAAFGVLRQLCDLADKQPGGAAGVNDPVSRKFVYLCQHRLLNLVPLRHRLLHQLHTAKGLLHGGSTADPVQGLAGRLPGHARFLHQEGQVVGHLLTSGCQLFVTDIVQHRLVALHDEIGAPACTDDPGTQACDPLDLLRFHSLTPPLFCGSPPGMPSRVSYPGGSQV